MTDDKPNEKSTEYSPAFETEMNNHILSKYKPEDRNKLLRHVDIITKNATATDLRDRDLLQRFCQYVFVNVKGNTRVLDLAEKWGIKVNLKKKKKVTFSQAQPQQHKISQVIKSKEGKIQQEREKVKPRQKNQDSKKLFKPTIAYTTLEENQTAMIAPYQNKPLELMISNNSKPLNSINFTLEDIISNPQMLNKYAN